MVACGGKTTCFVADLLDEKYHATLEIILQIVKYGDKCNYQAQRFYY